MPRGAPGSDGDPSEPVSSPDDAWKVQFETLGTFIRGQRQLANMTLRELSSLTDVSNAYLSQIERGLHQPSVRVLRSVADALNVSAGTLLARAGLMDEDGEAPPVAPASPPGESLTVAAILADPGLTPAQREALLSVYRSFSGDAGTASSGETRPGGP